MNNILIKSKTGGVYVFLDTMVKDDEVYLIVGNLVSDEIVGLPVKSCKLEKYTASKLLSEYMRNNK